MPEKSRKNADPKPDTTTTTPLVMGQQMVDSIVLEEGVDPEYNPTNEEVEEYATWLGMDLTKDKYLLWIAREGLKSPLPENWKPCKTADTEEIYYFNFETGESTWDHPCDAYYRKIFEDHQRSRPHRRLQKLLPRDKKDMERAEGRLLKLVPSGKDQKKTKKARASSTSNSYNGKDDSPRPNKKAAKGLRDLTSMAPKNLGFSPDSVRSTVLYNDNAAEPADSATVPSEPDIAVGGKESLASGITSSSAEQHVSLTENNLQRQRKQLAKELEVAAETEKGGHERLQALHNKIISEEENQKADVNNFRKFDAARVLVESRVGKLKEQLKEGLAASAEGVEKEEGREVMVGEVKDKVNDDQAVAHFKVKVESLEIMVVTLKEKLEVETKNKEEAECATSDALKEVSHVKTQVKMLKADKIILKDQLKRERKDREESHRVAKDSLSDLERVKVHNQQQMLDYKCQDEELRAKLEEVQQLESERRAEIDRLRAKQIENESRLKDGADKLDVSQQLGSERKKEIGELVDKQIEAERRLNDKGATLKELQCLESKRRAETKRLRENHVEAERRLKDEEEKTSRAKKEWDRKMEKAQKEMCKFVADAKLQAIDLQKQISNLREAGVSKRKKENEKAAPPQHPSTTASGVIPSEELRLIATKQFEDAAAATLEVKRLTQEVLTLETALTQSREIDVDITAKLRESEDQAKVLKQQLESYRGLEDQAEKRIEELNQSFQSSQKLYKQSSREVRALEYELANCRLTIQSMADREQDAKNEKKAWPVEKLELEHTVQSLRRQLEALSLVVKENEATQLEAGGAAAQLEDALMREDKLRNELDVAISKQKSAADKVKRVESCINREMAAKTSAEMLSKGFMQAALTVTTALSEVETALVSHANDSEPPGSSSRHEPTNTFKQFLAKAEAKISSLGKGNGVITTTTTSRTDTTTTDESDSDAISKVMIISLKEDSEKIIDELKSETLKLSSNAKEVVLKLVDIPESHSGTVSCLKKKICDSEERERVLNAAVQRGTEKLEALQAELLDSKSECDAACMQLNCVSRQLEHAEQELMGVSSRREDHPSSSSPERMRAKTVTVHTNREEETPLPTPGCGMGSCSSELHDWKERLRAEEQLLRSSGRALKNQKDRIRLRQNDLKARRDAWRHEWSRFEESIATQRKSESSSPIGQQRESFSAAKKSLDKEITALNTVTSQIKESSRWLKHREQKVKELNEAIVRALAENEGLLEMTSGPGPADDAARGYVSCLPSHSTCNSSSNTSSVNEDSSFTSMSVRRILNDLQEDVKDLQKRMKQAVPDPDTPLNEGTQAAAFHTFQQQQLSQLPPLYIIPPLAGYTCGFHVPAPPDVLPSASARPRPHHHQQQGYYASYPHNQPFPVFHDPENLESSLEAWLNARGRERPDDTTANKRPTTTQPPPNLRQFSADRREAHLAVSEAMEKLSDITADMGVHRFGASCAVSAVPPTAKEVMNNQSKKMSGSLSGSAAARGLNDATKAFTNTMGRTTVVKAR